MLTTVSLFVLPAAVGFSLGGPAAAPRSVARAARSAAPVQMGYNLDLSGKVAFVAGVAESPGSGWALAKARGDLLKFGGGFYAGRIPVDGNGKIIEKGAGEKKAKGGAAGGAGIITLLRKTEIFLFLEQSAEKNFLAAFAQSAEKIFVAFARIAEKLFLLLSREARRKF